jgi:hypothetical protein
MRAAFGPPVSIAAASYADDVRALLIAAVLALTGIAALLLARGGTGAPDTRAGTAPGAAPSDTPEGTPPTHGGPARDLPRTPQRLDELDRFVEHCVALGCDAVPLLARLLESGEDRVFAQQWEFVEGRLIGYPTLRSGYLRALASIPGDPADAALRRALRSSRSVQEAYQIALALTARGESGWSALALRHVAGPSSRGSPATQRALVTLVAQIDPEGVVEHLHTQAPRGDDDREPRALAWALVALPARAAAGSAGRLLSDPEITGRAKAVYLRSLCNRPDAEPALYLTLRDAIDAADLGDELRLEASYAAAGAAAILRDEIEYSRARAAGDGPRADRIKARFDGRLRAITALVECALGEDLERSGDPRAASIRRMLDKHRARMR